VNLNPSAPAIHGQIKIHKDNCPIRPIINWQNAPAYKLAKLLNKLIATYIPLPYLYNVKNTIQLIKDLTEIPSNQELKLISFDIDNMYPSIPTDKLIEIIKERCSEQDLEENITNELTKITQTIIEQNYFGFQSRNYTQQKGLAMGSPSSSILAEVYLQNLECKQIFKILTDNNIIGYFRYMEDILIIYNTNHTDINKAHTAFNNLTPTIKFTMEHENNNKINFLDITISKETDNFSVNIYRKPITTDIIICKTHATLTNTNTRLPGTC
jgi:hypothetical protein